MVLLQLVVTELLYHEWYRSYPIRWYQGNKFFIYAFLSADALKIHLIIASNFWTSQILAAYGVDFDYGSSFF